MTSPAKKPKVVDTADEKDLTDFGNFSVTRVLNENSEKKTIFVEGRFANDPSPAVVVMEKMPFTQDLLPQLFSSSSQLVKEFKNDIYGKYECLPDPKVNSLKVNVIHPATDKHIEKYLSSPLHIVNETAAYYQTITLPFIQSEKFTLDWVYNILAHRKEAERIVYEDPDPETGFILLPDFKWSCKQIDDLYLIAIVHAKNIKSLRDLNQRHLPLLKKLWNKGTKAIEAKYGVHHSQIRAYIHYQPSYYHLHVHFTHLMYNAPGINAEKSHLLPTIIRNIERQPDFYSTALLPFTVKEGDNLYKAYERAGYDFGSKTNAVNGVSKNADQQMEKLLEFFAVLGKAKHEPCGEHWNASYGESAWRMAVMAMCLTPELNRKRVLKIALTSAFTCMGKEADERSEWEQKLSEVKECLCRLLPLRKASEMYELYCAHVYARRGLKPKSGEDRAYRKLLELEEALLHWEELQKEGSATDATMNNVLRKMKEVGFPGQEKYQMYDDDTELKSLLKFFISISSLLHLRRTGWVRSGVHDPERVAGHMYRMAVMALLLEEDSNDNRILNGSAMIIALVHDVAECVIGDLTPSDPISAQDKHDLEMEAMRKLVGQLPTGRMSLELYNGLERYEAQLPGDHDAILAKDLDKFDMIMQAYEYEGKEKSRGGAFLQDFFDSTQGCFKSATVQEWDQYLRKTRNKRVEEKR